MPRKRLELQLLLSNYVGGILTDIKTVRDFCKNHSKWVRTRKREIRIMSDIKDGADKIKLDFSHINESEDKGKAFCEYMKNKVVAAENSHAELEKMLEEVLKGTLGGLEKLDCFLDAVEKLAVTSLHVFTKNQILCLPEGISPEHVQTVITAARLICPLLVEFKRDAKEFFLPKLQNVEVLAYQLEKYNQRAEEICQKLEESFLSDACLRAMDTVVFRQMNIQIDMSEDGMQSMQHQLVLLEQIRSNPNFRMVFLFQEVSPSHFISKFNERQPRMAQFLNDLEECAVQLDRMKKGAKISSVAGSSVAAVGGVLSIVGLALAPVTAGVSLALTMTGIGLGITSSVNSAVTTLAGIHVNQKHKKKATETFQSFMEDMKSLQDCLEEVPKHTISKLKSRKIDLLVGAVKITSNAIAIGKGIDRLVDAVSAVKALKNEKLLMKAGKVVAQEGKVLSNAPRVAADIPDIGQATVKGPLALSKSVRVGAIALSALFLGMDIFFICKDSISLAKGSETQVSQILRARAALWNSEMDSWQKIRDSLTEGLLKYEENKRILDTPFYPDIALHKTK